MTPIGENGLEEGGQQYHDLLSNLNPIDFYMGHLKEMIYLKPIPNFETIKQRIAEACTNI